MNRINRVTSLEMLSKVPVPEKTRTYMPISHVHMDSLTREMIEKNNFSLQSTEYLTAKNGNQAIGKYNISYGGDPDMGLMIAFQNSYDKTTTVKFAIGGFVFVCSNGMVMGDLGAFKHKHAGEVQQITPEIISEYIKKSDDILNKMIINKNKMKEIEVTKKTCAELIGRMFVEESVITANQLSVVKNELLKPSFDYGVNGTLYNLYNDCTFAVKESHPMYWLDNHIKINNFLTKEYQLA